MSDMTQGNTISSSDYLTGKQVMVVIPTYNEIENLPLIVKELFALEIEGLEILVVDDGSPDGTGDKAEELRAEYDERVHILHRSEKNGLGPAYLAGFRHAISLGADVLVQMDADFSHQPKYVKEMLQYIGENDAVIGSRFMKGGGVDESWGAYRKALSLWANRIYTPLILQMPLYDSTGGFRVWRREVLEGMDLNRVQSNGYVFQVEMSYVAYRLGYKLREYPIFFPDRERGESKMDPSIAIEAALRVWQILWRHRNLSKKDRV